jgi:hypothetical protein
MFFTCAGWHGRLPIGFLPTAVRNRLLRRGLSFGPQAVVANGDHVYWDLPRPTSRIWCTSPRIRRAGDP